MERFWSVAPWFNLQSHPWTLPVKTYGWDSTNIGQTSSQLLTSARVWMVEVKHAERRQNQTFSVFSKDGGEDEGYIFLSTVRYFRLLCSESVTGVVVPGHPTARKLRSCYVTLACSLFISFKKPARCVNCRVLIEARCEWPVALTCPGCRDCWKRFQELCD